MYDSAKSCARQNHSIAKSFLWQCWSSPRRELINNTFSRFWNDLVEFISHGFDGLSNITDAIHLLCDNDSIAVYFKLYLALYADDTVILAVYQEQLQTALNSY